MTEYLTYDVPFVISDHALKRAVEMGVDGEQIREAMLNPRRVRDTTTGRQYRERGKVTVVTTTDEVPSVIVTVLWSTAAAWAEDADTVDSRYGRDADSLRALRKARKAQKQGRNRYR